MTEERTTPEATSPEPEINSASSEINRRDFIKTAGVAAGGMMLTTACATKPPGPSSAPAVATARKIGPNDKINVGLIGYGGRGHALLGQALALKDQCQVVAVCDVYERRAKEAWIKVDRAGQVAKKYNYYGDVLDRSDIDAVFIATPDHWHAPIALEAMRKGKDVYCEKPMTHTIPEAREMAETAERLQRVVQVGSQTTSADQWWKAKKAIQDGMIGKLLLSQGSYHRNSAGGEWNYGIDHDAGPDKTGDQHLDWDLWQKPAVGKYEWYAPRFFRFRKYWDYSGGIATDLFFHVMAPLNLCWANPEFPWRVMGMGGIYAFDDGREVPDTFMLTADYPSGHSVVLSSSMANSTHIPGLIRGHEGTITMVKHGMFESPTPSITVTPEKINGLDKAFKDKYGTEELEIKTEMKGDPLHAHFMNFFDCIRTRKQPTLNASVAYRVQVAITLSVESYQQGKVLYFDADKQTVTDRRPGSTMKLARPGVLNGDKVMEPDYGLAKYLAKNG